MSEEEQYEHGTLRVQDMIGHTIGRKRTPFTTCGAKTTHDGVGIFCIAELHHYPNDHVYSGIGSLQDPTNWYIIGRIYHAPMEKR